MPLDDTNWPTIETEVRDETTALLIRARGLLERGWCRVAQAHDAAGQRVAPRSALAVAWCADGALMAAGVPDIYDSYWSHPAITRLMAAINGRWICNFNDSQETVEPVLAAFDRAIANKEIPLVGVRV